MDIESYRDEQYMSCNSERMLRSVEINPTELCNRHCSFCPRSDRDIYKNRANHISLETIKNICVGLNEIEYTNRIGFVGFGEPLLHPQIIDCVELVKKLIPDVKWLEINTNGDKLTRNIIEKLSGAGCSHITVSMYDRDISDKLDIMSRGVDIQMVYRHHYSKQDNYNLNIVNRTELLKNTNVCHTTDTCYIPFYKLMIDWNGDVLLCNNDWSRQNVFGNVNNDTIYDIWFGRKMNIFRKKLLKTRKNCSPCKNCSVNGLKRGVESVNNYRKYHEHRL